MLPSPRVVARLDQIQQGARHHGDSFTAAPGGLKKRAEVVLANDHVGIEIYDVRNARLLISHSVAPGERFLCAPVSISVKERTGEGFERYTYWVSSGSTSTRSSARPAKARLYCRYERSASSNVIVEDLADNANALKPITHVCLLAGSGEVAQKSLHRVLAIYDDGQVGCFAAKFDTLIWQGAIPPSNAGFDSKKLFDVAVFDENVARTTMFKSRPDVLASLPKQGGQGNQQSQFLALIEGSEASSVRLRYFYLGQRGLVELSTLLLSDQQRDKAGSDEWTVYPRSGCVYHVERQQESAKITVLNITSIIPTPKHTLTLKDVSSVTRISSTTVAVISGISLKLINMRWGSLEDECSLSALAAGAPASHNAKLVSSFSSLGVLAILQDDALLTVNRSQSQDEQISIPKKRKAGGTLADAFGRGIGGSRLEKSSEEPQGSLARNEFGKRFVPPRDVSETKSIRDKFDSMKSESQTSLYDATMSETLELALGLKAKGRTLAPHLVNQSGLVSYAINDLFELQRSTTGADTGSYRRLNVKRMAPDSFRSLLTRGLLSKSFLESILYYPDGTRSDRNQLYPSAVVDALVIYDPSLQTLIYYLSSAPVLTETELVASLLHSLKAAEQAEKSEALEITGNEGNHMMLANGTTETHENKSPGFRDDHVDGTNGQAFDDDGDWPEPDYSEGIRHNAQSALRSCLERLSVCSDRDTCKALKAQMRSSELLTLIDYIRTELAAGGWLVRLVDEELEGEADLSMQTSQINILAKVMNCAVDSLGATAWLLGTTDATDASKNADKIAYMRAEVNAALGGIEESAALEQMIHEILLFSKNAEQKSGNNARESSVEPSGGEIIKMKSRQEEREDSMLPLGLRRSDALPTTKTLLGGKEVPRSKRNRAWLRNKKVPEYSFERIFI